MTEYSQIKTLIVEDSDVTREMEVEMLRDIGFTRIITATDGNEAISLLSQEKDIGFIISDWNMPILNGYDFLIWVRSEVHFKKIPFIMATAHGERRQASKAIKAGITGFISKPFGPDELKTVIHEALGIEKMNKTLLTVYNVYEKNGRTIIHPTGSITAPSNYQLKLKLQSLIESGCKKFCFDFEKVEDIDSTSLTLFVVFVKMLNKKNITAELEIINCNNSMKNLFNITGLTKHYMLI